MSAPRFLVTGAYGCIGAWVVHELLGRGLEVTTFDLSQDRRRLRLLLEPEALAAIPHVAGDIGELALVERAIDEHEITNVVHLAALQVPFCRADPPLGARVNVLGTINVFEAVKRRRERMAHVVYASSVAAFDVWSGGSATMSGQPGTIYGVYKRANESSAWVYRAESGLASVGMRPHTIYGVGRDQGVTSAPTVAMLAAAAGVPAAIPYGGSAQFQLTRDAARAFVEASLAGRDDAVVVNLPGQYATIAELVAAVETVVPASAGSIEHAEAPLSFPDSVDDAGFTAVVADFVQTPLLDGVRETVERFRLLLAEGLVAPPAAPAGG